MDAATEARRPLQHLAFVGDCMLLFAVASAVLFSVSSSALSVFGLSAGFGVLSLILAPALTLAAVSSLYGQRPDRRAFALIGLSSALVVAVSALLYYLTVVTAFDESEAFGSVAIGILCVLGLVALATIADATRDLISARSHQALDWLRLVMLGVAGLLLALFAANPDFGVVVMGLATLGLAGAATGLIGDLLLTLDEHRQAAGRAGSP